MKNILTTICLAALSIFFFSCQKENVDDGTYIKTKIDENWTSFSNARFYFGNDTSTNINTIEIFGGDQMKSFAITLKTPNAITAGEYVSNDSLSSYQLFLNFTQNNALYLQAFSNTQSSPNIQPAYTLTITSYAENEIRGKITGNYLYNEQANQTLNLTEGEFVAQKINQ